MKNKSHLKNRLALCFCVLILCITAACEEILDIDVNQIPQQLVVNGSVSSSIAKTQVRLSLTSNVFKEENIKKISGARVTINDEQGQSEVLIESEPGLYKAATLYGVPGRTYSLKINYGENTYTATSRMPQQIELDSIRFTKKTSSVGVFPFITIPTIRYDAKCYLKNIVGVDEYCLLRMYNEQTKSNIFKIVYQDKYTDGSQIIVERKDLSLDTYSNYTLEILSVDKEIHTYLYQLEEKSKEWSGDILELFNSSSFNPRSNVTNALGYFSASSTKSYSIRLNSANTK